MPDVVEVCEVSQICTAIQEWMAIGLAAVCALFIGVNLLKQLMVWLGVLPRKVV